MWGLHAKKKVANSDIFESTRFQSEHTCSIGLCHKDHHQAAPWVRWHVIKKKYVNDGAHYLPNNILKEKYGIEITYDKACRSIEKAL